MTKNEATDQLKSLLGHCQTMRESGEIWARDVEALNLAIAALAVHEIIDRQPAIDPESLFFTVGKRADYLEKLYTKIRAVTRLTPERLLELFMEGYTLQAPDHRKELEEMQRIAWMDLPGQNGGQDRCV